MGKGKPGRKCSICVSSRRKAIEAAIVKGLSNRAIGRQFNVGSSAIFRHKAHIAETLAIAAQARGIELGSTLLDGLQSIAETFARLCKTCEVTGDYGHAIEAGKESRVTLETIRSWQMSVPVTNVPGAQPRVTVVWDKFHTQGAINKLLSDGTEEKVADLGFKYGGRDDAEEHPQTILMPESEAAEAAAEFEEKIAAMGDRTIDVQARLEKEKLN
jgi:hypothetical protein